MTEVERKRERETWKEREEEEDREGKRGREREYHHIKILHVTNSVARSPVMFYSYDGSPWKYF